MAGINVNCIAPGVFPSKMARYFTDDETRKEFTLATIPMGPSLRNCAAGRAPP